MKRHRTSEAVLAAHVEAGGRIGHSRHAALVTWLVAIVAVALVATAGVIGWREYQVIVEARALVSQATALLQSAEDDLVIVDEAVRTEVSSEIATSSLEASALVGSVRADALAAASLIASALADLPEDEVAHAQALKEGAEARAEMMLQAPTILDAGYKAARSIGLADDAVAEITAAEDLIAQAAAEFNKHTAAGVKQSDAYTVQAETRLKASESLLTSATAAFPEADFSAFTAYVQAKLQLCTMAKEIDALWLSGKIAESNAKLTAYNKRDAEVVAMAKALPSSVRGPIADAYESATAEARAAYFVARELAREADARANGAAAGDSVDATGSVDASTSGDATPSGATTGTGR